MNLKTAIETIQNELHREKYKNKMRTSVSGGVPKVKEQDEGMKTTKIFEEMMSKSFPNLMKTINSQIPKGQ